MRAAELCGAVAAKRTGSCVNIRFTTGMVFDNGLVGTGKNGDTLAAFIAIRLIDGGREMGAGRGFCQSTRIAYSRYITVAAMDTCLLVNICQLVSCGGYFVYGIVAANRIAFTAVGAGSGVLLNFCGNNIVIRAYRQTFAAFVAECRIDMGLAGRNGYSSGGTGSLTNFITNRRYTVSLNHRIICHRPGETVPFGLALGKAVAAAHAVVLIQNVIALMYMNSRMGTKRSTFAAIGAYTLINGVLGD